MKAVAAIAAVAAVVAAGAPAADAANVHIDARDLSGAATLTHLADGRWRVAFPGGTLTVDEATADQWADQIRPPPPAGVMFQSSLATNCTTDAFWTHADLGLAENPDWFCESGDNLGGHVVEGVYRQWTRRTDLQNYRVTLGLRLNGFNSFRSDAVAGWNGFKIWMHRKLQTPGPGGRVDDGSTAGYTAEPALRDGRVYVQKKVGDIYCVLSATPSFPYPLGSFHEVGGEVRNNPDGTVTVGVLRDGLTLVQATDRGQCLGPPLRGPGRIGLRGDNVDMDVRDLAATGL